MNISMNDIKLIKPDGQKWIYISEDGSTATTKLLYDDGTDPDILETIKATLNNIANKNVVDTIQEFLEK